MNNKGIDDAISREAIKEKLIKRYQNEKNEFGYKLAHDYLCGLVDAFGMIDAEPAVTIPEKKIGYWKQADYKGHYKCSICLNEHTDPETGTWHEIFDYRYPYCPNCGAKMQKVEYAEE